MPLTNRHVYRVWPQETLYGSAVTGWHHQASIKKQEFVSSARCSRTKRTGLMKVLVVSTNRSKLPLPVLPMGACMVAQAAQRAGHQVELLDLMFEKSPHAALQSAIEHLRPDVVGISVRNIDNNDMQETVFFLQGLHKLIRTIRSATSASVVIGGAAMAVMPEELLRLAEIDYGVISDGERTFPLLLDRLKAGEPVEDLPGIAYLDKGVFHRNNPSVHARQTEHCPQPDYQSFLRLDHYRAHMAAVPVQSKLGCQFDCVYCTYPKIEGAAYRLFDPESVADTVSHYSLCGMRDIEFVDNIFNVPYDHAMAVCAALARRRHGARLQTLELNPLCVSDPLLRAMERAGFVGVGITAESASDTVLQGLRKGYSSREVFHAAEVIRSHRLPCTWIFLLGGPGETMQTARETLRFAQSAIRPHDMAFFNVGVRIYPGTELENIARRQGMLAREAGDLLHPVFYVSPLVNLTWLRQQVREATSRHMNFLSSGSISLPFLPTMHRIAHWIGVNPPLWRYTPIIRRSLSCLGIATG